MRPYTYIADYRCVSIGLIADHPKIRPSPDAAKQSRSVAYSCRSLNESVGDAVAEMTLMKQARLLRTLSHPGRLEILAVLGKGEACVCHLAAALGRSQPYVSQQLAILRAAGLITSRRQGTFTYYALRDFSVLGVVDLADRLVGNPILARTRPTTLPECGCPACRLAPPEDDHAH